MNKIMIIGSGGSGKSTLARRLGEITNLPVYHLDALHWKPGWVPTLNEEWDELQRELIKKDKWILDGNYGRTLDIRMAAADCVIFFDLPPWITTYRLIKRRVQYHGKTRPDLAEGCPEKLDLEFIKWVWNFRKNKRPGILQKLSQLPDAKHIIILMKRKEVNELIEEVRSRYNMTSNLSMD